MSLNHDLQDELAGQLGKLRPSDARRVAVIAAIAQLQHADAMQRVGRMIGSGLLTVHEQIELLPCLPGTAMRHPSGMEEVVHGWALLPDGRLLPWTRLRGLFEPEHPIIDPPEPLPMPDVLPVGLNFQAYLIKARRADEDQKKAAAVERNCSGRTE